MTPEGLRHGTPERFRRNCAETPADSEKTVETEKVAPRRGVTFLRGSPLRGFSALTKLSVEEDPPEELLGKRVDHEEEDVRRHKQGCAPDLEVC